MTPKQQQFVIEYLIDLNGKQAAIRAGYSARSAEEQSYQLLRKTSVRAAVAEAREKLTKRTEISVDFVLNGLRENYDRAMMTVPVYDRDGKDTGEYTYAGAVANRSLELIGKHLGMFGDRPPPVPERVVQTPTPSLVLPATVEEWTAKHGPGGNGRAH